MVAHCATWSHVTLQQVTGYRAFSKTCDQGLGLVVEVAITVGDRGNTVKEVQWKNSRNS